MHRIFGSILRQEFVVDESPEPVAEDFARKRRAPANMEAPVAAPVRRGESSSGAASQDMRAQICLLLRDQERLELLAEELKASKGSSGKEELSRLFRSALTLLDSFDRVVQMSQALPPSEELHNWMKSIAIIQTRMLQLFERFGLRTMDPVGQRVDLDRHEVIEVLRTESLPDETIVEVRQKGYIFDGKVLRDARVVVTKNDRKG
jgi:molecular chaperone GrpE